MQRVNRLNSLFSTRMVFQGKLTKIIIMTIIIIIMIIIIIIIIIVYLFNFYDTLIKSFLPRFLFIYLFFAQIIV